MYVVNTGGRLGAGNAAVTEWLLPAFVIIFRTSSVFVRNCFWTRHSDLFFPPLKLDCFPKKKINSHLPFPANLENFPHNICPSDGHSHGHETEQGGDPEVTNSRGGQGSAPVKSW